MAFSHDTRDQLEAAAVLVNSAEPPDTLTTVADLEAFITRFSYTGRYDRSTAELEQVRALRSQLREFFMSSRDDAVAIVNQTLAEARAVPQLVRHGDTDWHVHAVPGDASLVTRINVETAMAMVDVIRADEMSRIGVCADGGCAGVVVDLSRNRSKRFCSVTCGNRNAVAAYRARQR